VTRISNFVLAAAAAGTTIIALFFGLPALVHQANEAAFNWPLANLLPVYWPFALLIFFFVSAPAAVLPARLGRFWAAGAVIIAVYAWAHGSFQTYDFGSVDGLNFNPTVPLEHATIEIVIIIGMAILVSAFALRAPKAAAIIVLLPALGLLVETVPGVIATPAAPTIEASRIEDIASLSPHSNVVVVLLDAMQSDIFEDLVRSDVSLAEALDGFTLYADTLGAASTTYLTMPSLHAGVTYRGEAILPYFRTAVGQRSVMTKVAGSGYRGILVNEIQRICPEQIECISSLAALTGDKDSIIAEASTLMDSVLFRVAPLFLKAAIYNDGRWIIQPWTADPRIAHRVVEGNEFLKEVGGALNVSASTPQLRFFHLFSTHPPFVLDDKCSYVEHELDFNRTNVEQQVHCALRALAGLLSAMKVSGAYDQSHIIIMSDHGIGLESTRTTFSTGMAVLMGQANPTFAIKPAGATGPFQTAYDPVHIGDFGATLCDMIGSCVADAGISALSEVTTRSRIFNQYSWRHEYWLAETIPDLTQYRVIGPLGDSSSWFPGPLQDLPINDRIDFRSDGTGLQYLGVGWHRPEDWGTWSGSQSTSLFAQLPSLPDNVNLRIAATAFVRAEHPSLNVIVKINDRSVDTLMFDVETSSMEAVIPLDAAGLNASGGLLKVTFENRTAATPTELGISDDPRLLGIGLLWAEIEEGT
jgi:hypothetical protein